MRDFFKMSEKDMIFFTAAVAVMLTEGLSVDEQNTLGNFLLAVGQSIITGAQQKEVREKLISEKQDKQNNQIEAEKENKKGKNKEKDK